MPWIDGCRWEEPTLSDFGDFGPNIRGYLRAQQLVRECGPPQAGWSQPIHHPHYTDARFARGQEHTLFGATEDGLDYVYSDRLRQWDPEKARDASASADHPEIPKNSPLWYEHYLSAYFVKPVSLRHIIGGVNVSNGYEYFIFGYKEHSDEH